jgi:RNA polymerase sigma factor (sigma-70 family)
MPYNANCNDRSLSGLQVFDGPSGKESGGQTRHTMGRSPSLIHEFDASLGTDAVPDEVMLVGFRGRDPERAEAFVHRFKGRVYGLALTMTGDPVWADDIAQDAFLRAWRGASSFDPARGSVSTWLLTITRNAALDALRRHRPESLSAHAETFLQMVAADSLPADAAALEDGKGAARAALGRIPLEQRRAVVLASVLRLTAPEIAEAEGVSVGTAKSRIRSGMLKLRTQLHVTKHACSADTRD